MDMQLCRVFPIKYAYCFSAPLHDVIMSANHQPHECLLIRLFKAQIKENIKAPRHWPLLGEFTGDRWIPHKGPVARKTFPIDDVIMFILL